MGTPPLVWRKTNAPIATSRTDDIWFVSPDEGWAVNSNGQIIKTEDGGRSWTQQHADASAYLRCVGFAGNRIGWVGSISATKRMFATRDGVHWSLVENLPPAPRKVCGLSVVNDKVVYGSGTNDPRDAPAILKTTDGGATWTMIDMRAHASLLVDIHFDTPDRGWVVGGRATVSGQPVTRAMVQPVVLFTQDGGASWTDLVPDKSAFPMGEWGWKIFFVDDRVAFVSLENFTAGAILKSTDGGATWRRMKINDQQQNTNLEGVGFISEQVGWVGGWGNTSSTVNGGENWANANEVGRVLNRFRFFGQPVTVGYASGDTVYKYSDEALPLVADATLTGRVMQGAIAASAAGSHVTVDIPRGTGQFQAHLWDRFGNHLELAQESSPTPGKRTVSVDVKAAIDAGFSGPSAILRVAIDGLIESRLVPLQ